MHLMAWPHLHRGAVHPWSSSLCPGMCWPGQVAKASCAHQTALLHWLHGGVHPWSSSPYPGVCLRPSKTAWTCTEGCQISEPQQTKLRTPDGLAPPAAWGCAPLEQLSLSRCVPPGQSPLASASARSTCSLLPQQRQACAEAECRPAPCAVSLSLPASSPSLAVRAMLPYMGMQEVSGHIALLHRHSTRYLGCRQPASASVLLHRGLRLLQALRLSILSYG